MAKWDHEDLKSIGSAVGSPVKAIEVTREGYRNIEIKKGPMRTFGTGANRTSDVDKPDYIGYLSPLVIGRFGEYMLKHQVQPDGTKRPSDNWKKGIPIESYLQSMMRHFLDVWLIQETGSTHTDLEDALCGVMFNAMGLLHETIKARR